MCQSLGGKAKVSCLAIQLDDVVLRHVVGRGNRRHEQPFAEADLDWFEEGREPALDQVRDRTELVRRTGRVDAGQDSHELLAAVSRLQCVQVRGQIVELHGWSRYLVSVSAPGTTRRSDSAWTRAMRRLTVRPPSTPAMG